MTRERGDRRVSRTRRVLHEALRSLILERGFDEVTVQHVIDRADVGRATFYAHFRGKDDLLTSGFEEMRQSLRQILSMHSRDGLGFIRILFEHAADHRREYRARVGSWGGGDITALVEREVTSIVQSQLREAVARRRMHPSVPPEVVTRYVVSALLALLKWWLDNDLPYTAEQMAEMFERLTAPAVAAGMGGRYNPPRQV